MISTRNFANPNHAKNCGGYHNAGDQPKCEKFIIKMGNTKMDLILIKRVYCLTHKFSLSIHLVSTKFCLSSNCVQKILVHIYLL